VFKNTGIRFEETDLMGKILILEELSETVMIADSAPVQLIVVTQTSSFLLVMKFSQKFNRTGVRAAIPGQKHGQPLVWLNGQRELGNHFPTESAGSTQSFFKPLDGWRIEPKPLCILF
jgi:hypothetical protein